MTMMQGLGRIALVGTLCLFSAVAAVSYNENQLNEDFVNAKLYVLKRELDVLERIYESETADSELQQAAENMVIGTILGASLHNPAMSDLQGVPLRALCISLVLSKRPEFGSALQDKRMLNLAKNYLSGIESDLMQKTETETSILYPECAHNKELQPTTFGGG